MSFAQKSEKKWTEEEDDILRAAVAEYGKGAKINWQKISDCLPGRSNKSCRKRWIHSLDPSLRKGRWTSNEDAVLLDAVSQHGQNWSKVARHVEGRTDDQCAKRWRENLDPAISREPWTQEEDKILLEALRVHGQKWNTISTLLPGRASVHCRNRYSRLRRARDTQAPGESRTSSPGEGDVEQASSSSYPTPPDNRNRHLPDELLRLSVDTAGASTSRSAAQGPMASSSAERRGGSAMSPLSPSSMYDPRSSLSLSPTTPTSPHQPPRHPHSHPHQPHPQQPQPVNNHPELSHRLLEAFFNDPANRNREGRWYPAQPGDEVFLFSTTEEEEFMRNIQRGGLAPAHPTHTHAQQSMNVNMPSSYVPNPSNRGYDAGRGYMAGYQLESAEMGGMPVPDFFPMGTSQMPQQYPSSSSVPHGQPQFDPHRYQPPSQGQSQMPQPSWQPHANYPPQQQLQQQQQFEMPALDSSNEALNLATLSAWLSMTLPPEPVDTTPEVSGSTSPGSSETFESSPSSGDEDGYSTVHGR